MKCVKNGKSGEVRRVTNGRAEALILAGWQFVPKSEWKLTSTDWTPNNVNPNPPMSEKKAMKAEKRQNSRDPKPNSRRSKARMMAGR